MLGRYVEGPSDDVGSVRVVLLVVGAFALAFFAGWAVQLTWNYVVPDVFGLPKIGYMQAMALYTLCSLLRGVSK